MARPSLETLPKFKALVVRLGIPKPYVRGLLDTMWDTCHTNGDPRIGTAEEVEAAAEWPGEPGLFFAAIRDRWLDEVENEPGVYAAHDYWDHAPRYAADRAKREAERRAKGFNLSELRAEAGRRGGLAKASKSLASGSNLLETSSKHVANGSKGLANGATPAPAPAPALSSRAVERNTEIVPSQEGKAPPARRSASRASTWEFIPLPEDLAAIPIAEGLVSHLPSLAKMKTAGEVWEYRVRLHKGRDRPTMDGQHEQIKYLRDLVAEDGAAEAAKRVVYAAVKRWRGFEAKFFDSWKTSRPNGSAGFNAGIYAGAYIPPNVRRLPLEDDIPDA